MHHVIFITSCLLSLYTLYIFCVGHILVLAFAILLCPCMYAKLLYTKKNNKKQKKLLFSPAKPPSSLRFVSLLVCLLCQLLWKTRCARRTVDQSDGIYNSYSTVARDLWQRKPPLSSGYALGLGSVYCHKSQATGL